MEAVAADTTTTTTTTTTTGGALKPPVCDDFHIGTSGYTYPHWRKDKFYPRLVKQDDELKHYSGVLSSCEINATYHSLQKVETFEKWKKQVRKGFVFSLKMHQVVTHKNRLNDVEELVTEFCLRARHLGEYLGVILVQLPPHFPKNTERLEKFLKILPSDLRFAFEFRNDTWLSEDVYSLLTKHNAAIVENVSMDDSCVYTDRLTANFSYLRFHKSITPGDTVYSDEKLEKEAVRLAERRNKLGITQFVYFMNDIGAHGPHNAKTLAAKVEAHSDKKRLVANWKKAAAPKKMGAFFGAAAKKKTEDATPEADPVATKSSAAKAPSDGPVRGHAPQPLLVIDDDADDAAGIRSNSGKSAGTTQMKQDKKPAQKVVGTPPNASPSAKGKRTTPKAGNSISNSNSSTPTKKPKQTLHAFFAKKK